MKRTRSWVVLMMVASSFCSPSSVWSQDRSTSNSTRPPTSGTASASSNKSTASMKPEEAQRDLEKVRKEIGQLQKQLAQKRQEYKEATSGLEESEKAVSEAAQALLKLQEEYEDMQKSLGELQTELRLTDQNIQKTQAAFQRFLRKQYMQGQRVTTKEVLKIAPWDKMAQTPYRSHLAYMARAYNQKMAVLKGEHEKKAKLIEARAGKVQSLDEIRLREQEEHKTLETQLEERKTAVELLNKQLTTQETRLASLKKDEAQMTHVLAQIRKRIAAEEKERQRKQEAARKEAQRQREIARQRELEAQQAAKEAGQAIPESKIEEGPIVVQAVTDDAYGAVPFKQLKGQLQYPVTGYLMNQFGGQRSDTGSKWKGIFIQAASGQPVKAVAAGRVVFSDAMRGYGNLLIIDHGDGYLSIYGHNATLLKANGVAVKAGETIATVGNSGGLENFGLYFELRHQDQPIDPVQWMKK